MGQRFKHAFGVTRYSDLGEGSAPFLVDEVGVGDGLRRDDHNNNNNNKGKAITFGSREYTAITNDPGEAMQGYRSFEEVGRLTLCSRFEMAVGNEVPGERVLPLEYEGMGKDNY